MTHEAILPLEIQVLSLAVLGAFSGWVLWLIRTQRLHLREDPFGELREPGRCLWPF